MQPGDIALLRLRQQRLSGIPFESPAAAAQALVAVQAQDYAGAKWALGLRLEAARDADIDRVFNRGDILRTHVLRPTWHFVAPVDIRWLLALTASRVHAANAAMYRRLELDTATLKRCHKAIAKALRDGQHLTRKELSEALAKAGIAATGQRLAYVVMHAELERLICSGPRRGKQFTYALLEERVLPAAPLTRDASLAELTRRYFTSHGPATVQDFAKWSGLTTVDAKRGLGAAKDQLQCEEVKGSTYWFAPSASSSAGVSPTAYLLSVFDEYITGYKDRSMLGSPEVIAKLFTMGNALTYIIVIDGQIVGAWRRTLSKDAVNIETQFFTRLTQAQDRAIATAAQRYGEFVGKPVTLI